MKKKPQERKPVQLNMDQTPAEQEQTWTLEEIMDEFGGWTKREQPKAETADALQQEPETVQPVSDEKEPEAESVQKAASDEGIEEPADAPQTESVVRIFPAAKQQEEAAQGEEKEEQAPPSAGDTIRFAPVTEEQVQSAEQTPKVWTYKGEPDPEPETLTKEEQKRAAKEKKAAEQAKKRLEQLERKQEKTAARRVRRQERPEHSFDSLQQAYTYYARPSTLRLRMFASTVLALVSILILFFSTQSFGTAQEKTGSALLSELMLVIMLLQCLLMSDLLLPALRRALLLRFDQYFLLVLQIAVTAADAVLAILSNRIPFCTVVSLELAVCMWGRQLLHTARRKSLKVVCNMSAPVAAVREEKAWHGLDCIFRAKADADEFAVQLEMPDAGGRIMRIYTPILIVVTLGLSVLCSIRSEEYFLRAWTSFLLVGFPTGILLAYGKPFASVAKRLSRMGCAVSGWNGARILGGEVGVCVEDADLFPPQNVTLNGMKIYSDRNVSQVIGFAMAVVQTAGSGLVPLFEELMHAQNGRRYSVDNFRRYEGGGLGAEIHGDVILMGSIGFMRLMKVQMPEGAKLKQAIYLSVNGELAAVFALNYAPAANVKSSLFAMIHSGGLIPILATRDFMITPQFLKQRYKISPDRVEFPTVEERARLSSGEAILEPKQGAMMARSGFSYFASAVTGARAMRTAGRGSIAVALAGAILGILMLFFLTFIGAERAVTCWNLTIYQLLWLLPSILMTSLLGFGAEEKK